MLDGIIFDFDGTIAKTDTRQFKWYKHWNMCNEREKFGYNSNFLDAANTSEESPKSDELKQISADLEENPGKLIEVETFEEFLPIYNKMINFGGAQFVYDAFGLPCDMSDRSHPVWVAFDNYNIKHPAPLYPGIKEMIEELWDLTRLPANPIYNKQIRMAINTTNSWKSVHPNLVKYGVNGFFDSHVCSEALKEYEGSGNYKAINKPSKVSVALSLLLLDSPGDTTIFVGDTKADLGACINVRRNGLTHRKENLITIGVDWGFEGKESLSEGVSTPNGQEYFKHIVTNPNELVSIVRDYLPKDWK